MRSFFRVGIVSASVVFATALHGADMTGGIYRIELSLVDCGGACTSNGSYWHCDALGQTEGVGGISSLPAYNLDVGVLAQPVPEGAAGLCALIACLLWRCRSSVRTRRNHENITPHHVRRAGIGAPLRRP